VRLIVGDIIHCFFSIVLITFWSLQIVRKSNGWRCVVQIPKKFVLKSCFRSLTFTRQQPFWQVLHFCWKLK